MNARTGGIFGVIGVSGMAVALAAIGSLLAGCAGMSGTVGNRGAACACPDTARVAQTRLAGPEEAGNLTFEAMVGRMSESLLRAPAGTAWKPGTGPAAEVREARGELSLLVEDAEWVLALARALEGPLPQEDKARLRRLHEAYAAHAPHSQVAAQVSALLQTVRDEALRRDLKKLANRSWEREKRGKSAPASSTAPATPAPPAPSIVAPTAPPAATDDPGSPERFCSERRAEAARLFSDARSTVDPAGRERLLRLSLEALDACITRHPATPEAEKARQNRERVEQELKR